MAQVAYAWRCRNHDQPTKLAQAVTELGRLEKTIHILTYIDDESVRRRVLLQLNRHEERHKLARAVFHGKRGELRKRYREGQEDQLGALGLVVNMIVLWNTIYMDAALKQLRAEGYPVRPEDVARPLPRPYLLSCCCSRPATVQIWPHLVAHSW